MILAEYKYLTDYFNILTLVEPWKGELYDKCTFNDNYICLCLCIVMLLLIIIYSVLIIIIRYYCLLLSLLSSTLLSWLFIIITIVINIVITIIDYYCYQYCSYNYLLLHYCHQSCYYNYWFLSLLSSKRSITTFWVTVHWYLVRTFNVILPMFLQYLTESQSRRELRYPAIFKFCRCLAFSNRSSVLFFNSTRICNSSVLTDFCFFSCCGWQKCFLQWWQYCRVFPIGTRGILRLDILLNTTSYFCKIQTLNLLESLSPLPTSPWLLPTTSCNPSSKPVLVAQWFSTLAAMITQSGRTWVRVPPTTSRVFLL